MNQANTPTPTAVNWLGYIAITLLLTLPVSVMMVRSGAWQQGLMVYALSCLGAALLLSLAILAMLLPRFAPWRKTIATRALFTLPGTALLLVLLGGRGDIPPIHDITTDLQDPPIFTIAPQQRGEHSNGLDINPDTIAKQREGYPDVQSTLTDMDIDTAFDRAIAVATAMNWDIYHQDRNAGVIEAVDTTAIMGFKDDIIIRLRTNADGTLIDVRSVSRVGVSDLGANAKRIRAFQQQIQP